MNEDGRGRSIWDRFAHMEGTIADGINRFGASGKIPGPAIQAPVGPIGGGKRVAVLAASQAFVVADPAVLRLVGLSHADAVVLRRAGILSLGPGGTTNSSSSVSVTVGRGATAQTVSAPFARHHVHATAGIAVLITPGEAQRLHAPIEPAGVIITNPTRLDETQRASLDALQPTIMFGTASGPTTSAGTITEMLWTGPRSSDISPDTVRQIVLAIVVLIALVVLAMSLALSAAETRDERDVLVSLGARPATMRGVASWKAATLAFTGAALAIPTGFIPVAVVYLAAVRPGEHARLAFPWSTTLELLMIAPVIAAAVAAIGSAVAQHFRPTQMSTFSTD